MGDAGEGLVDAEARIQERLEELQNEREQSQRRRDVDPEKTRKLESLRLARKELSRQFEATSHQARKNQLAAAMEDLDNRIAQIESA